MGRFSRSTALRALPLLAIVLIAAILRATQLPSRGLIYWDEGKFLLEGVRLETGLRLLAGAHGSMPLGKAIGTAKPTHALLIAAAFALLGIHDYAALFMNAFASVLAVVFVYHVATDLFDSSVGLLASLVLAVSEYDVIYARSALSESDANALLLLGVWLWLRHRRSGQGDRWRNARLLAAALVFGVAFTTNYRISVYVATIVAFDLIHGRSVRGFSSSLRRAGLWIGGCAIAPVLWQMVDLAARARGTVLFRSEITRLPTTYFGEVRFQLHEGKQAAVHFDPLTYVQWYVAYQGWVLALLVLFGAALAVRERSFAWLATVCPVIAPYLLYMWAPVIVPRNLAAAVPFTAILIAATVVLTLRRLGRTPATTVALLALAVVLGVDGTWHSWRLSQERSGFTRAVAYIESHDGHGTLTTNEIPVFYLRDGGDRCAVTPVPDSLQRLAADVRAGYSYALLDHQSGAAAQFIHGSLRRVARYPSTQTVAVGDNLIAAENSHAPRGPYPIPYVDVFRLSAVGLPPPAGARAGVCDLNVL